MTSAPSAPPPRGPALDPRAVAIANANMFRALAWRALRDGAPKAALRAANARAAARIILRHAREDAGRLRMPSGALDLAA
ncbi:MAG: hypothetical protein INR63_00490 [Actinomycetospora chiangmaiensis]|jgi:hypothetical protein|nr:hypothetical protein [Actinomycetospora chiangmaiensis]